jgi:hypothetical protein
MKTCDGARQSNIKGAMLLVLCLCLVFGGIGGVWAYLTASTQTLTNRFQPAQVSCEVEESFHNGVKSDVKIRNTGNVDAYVRAVVVATFVDNEGKVLSTAPKEGVDYAVTWEEGGWAKGSDGFWYCTDPVAPGNATAILIRSATAIAVPDGYRLHLQIVSSAIQSDPADAVREAWGITPTNDRLLPN